VEALNTTTIRRLTRSRRHQLLAIAPGSGAMEHSEAGVRKASREETAGKYVPAAVSVYGDLTRGSELLRDFRTGTPAE
jgi:hypothetical protein